MSNSNSIPVQGSYKRDMRGQVFGRLTVIEFAGRVKGPNAKQAVSSWRCLCECGSVSTVTGSNLIRGTSRSCGCLQKELASKQMLVHGLTRTSEWEAWRAMWDRCTNPMDPAYARYCDKRPPPEWRDFQVFYRDMGPKPGVEFTLDRTDNRKAYGPDNCRWATWHTQMRNRSVNVWLNCGGVRMVMADAMKVLGVSAHMAKRMCERVD